jgi:hypothetical protein
MLIFASLGIFVVSLALGRDDRLSITTDRYSVIDGALIALYTLFNIRDCEMVQLDATCKLHSFQEILLVTQFIRELDV